MGTSPSTLVLTLNFARACRRGAYTWLPGPGCPVVECGWVRDEKALAHSIQ